MKNIICVFLLSTICVAITIYTCNGQNPGKEIDKIRNENDSVSRTVKNGKTTCKLNMVNTKKATNTQSAWSVSRIGDTSKNKINHRDHH
jgi:hypothetical protein